MVVKGVADLMGEGGVSPTSSLETCFQPSHRTPGEYEEALCRDAAIIEDKRHGCRMHMSQTTLRQENPNAPKCEALKNTRFASGVWFAMDPWKNCFGAFFAFTSLRHLRGPLYTGFFDALAREKTRSVQTG